jgi:hypothetical protein
MSSGKQKRTQIAARRAAKARKGAAARQLEHVERRQREREDQLRRGAVAVDPSRLSATGSLSTPDFVTRGYYEAIAFECRDCGKQEVWTPTQQKWWYEVARGHPFTTATRCRPCRHKERTRAVEARREHLAGVARKPPGPRNKP